MRIPILWFTATVTCIVLSLVVAPAFSHADTIVYNNTQTSLGWIANKGFGVEEGNTITLDGSANARVVTQFSVGYLPFTPAPNSEVVGAPTLIVRFYSDTNTLLYNSGLISTPLGTPDQLQMQILTLDHLAVQVTDTFRWTAQFGGVTSAFSIPGGLFMFGPPTVGSFVSVYPGTVGNLICPGAITDCGSSETQSFYAQVQVRSGNLPPVCSDAQAFPAVLWSPKHQFVPIVVMGVIDPDGDAVTITVTGVTQDEPVNAKGDGNTSPDAIIQAGAASVRAERSGTGNGRVYQVIFKAEDGKGGSCTGAVTVGVPHSMQVGLTAIDDGQVYDSTVR